MVLVMDFPSDMAVNKLFESDAYAALIPTRDKGFTDMNIMIATDI